MGGAGETEPLFHFLSSKHVVLFLSFIGGFVDATGYIKLYGLFTSSITGNLVVACTAFFGSGHGVFARLFVSLAFAFGSFATTIATLKLRYAMKKNQWEVGLHLFRYEIFSLFITMIIGIGCDYAPGKLPGLDSWQSIWIGSLLALSMGVHNAAAQDLIANCPSTTVMTMTIVKTSIFAANAVQYLLASKSLVLMHAPDEKPTDYDSTMKKNYENYSAKFFDSVQPLIAFVFGATMGALLVLHMTFWCLLFPMGILASILYSIREAQRTHDDNHHVPIKEVELESATSPMAEHAAGASAPPADEEEDEDCVDPHKQV
jgi:uncharacterized membrane protein YoaK (UPF0700 family)